MATPISSGASSISANSGVSTNLIAMAATSGNLFAFGKITNSGSVEASFSVDDGVTWSCLAPASSMDLPSGNYHFGIKVKGNGGTATGLSAALWQGNVP